MRIVHIAASDVCGGAARAAHRLHKGLLREGVDSRMFVRRKRSDDPKVTAAIRSSGAAGRAFRRLRRWRAEREYSRYRSTRPDGFEPFDDDRTQIKIGLESGLPPCDILNLHFVAGFLDFESFFSFMPSRCPIVWRLPDLHALTGGCHYDLGCGKHLKGCGACPQLGSDAADDLAARSWRRKQRALKGVDPSRLHFVALNRWMAGQIQASEIVGHFPVTVIPNGLDTDEFAPRDKAACRDLLGIPEGERVILFVSEDVGNCRKGMHLLGDALARVRDLGNVSLLSIGGGKSGLEAPVPHRHFSKIDDNRLLSAFYNAADIYVIPSLQDNLPNTVLESLACGTPVAGFDVGGIPDMVRPGETGVLAAAEDATELGDAIKSLLVDENKRAALGRRCREIALGEYSLEAQARGYIDLYRGMLESK